MGRGQPLKICNSGGWAERLVLVGGIFIVRLDLLGARGRFRIIISYAHPGVGVSARGRREKVSLRKMLGCVMKRG